MTGSTQPATLVAFGPFEADLQSQELRKHGMRLRLSGQSFQVLRMLLERPGELVTREELRQALWPSDTFVDFEHGLNVAVNRLRETLEDSADSPNFIETLPRRGYRLIAPVGQPRPVGVATAQKTAGKPDSTMGDENRPASADAPLHKRWTAATILGFPIVLLAVVIAFNAFGVRQRLMELAGARHGPPAPTIQSIAVLPLENLSGDAEQEYFADGLTDELIATLAKVRSLRVISRTSIMQYKKMHKPLPQIGRELNVDAVLEGTVLRSGGRVRITAQLIDATTDRHLWADTYESEMRDVLVLQGEVARAIAEQIQMNLQPEEQARLASVRTVNPQAYEAYLKGRFFYFRETREDLPKAIHYGEQAIQIDPGYAPAYALLAACYYDSSQSRWGDVSDTEAAQKARATALKALQLDNSLAAAHVVLGAIHDGVDWDWAGAEREFRRAIELDPNLVQAHVGLAYHLAFVERSDEAIGEIDRAVELDPLSPYTVLRKGSILYLTRRYDELIKLARSWLEIYPDSASAYFFLAYSFEQKGMYDEDVAALQKTMTLLGEPADVVAGRGRAYKSGGIRGVWRYDLERQSKHPRREEAFGYYPVELNSLLGNTDKAIELIEKMYSDRASRERMFLIKMDPRLDNLRSDPRFQNILRRMNLPPRVQ